MFSFFRKKQQPAAQADAWQQLPADVQALLAAPVSASFGLSWLDLLADPALAPNPGHSAEQAGSAQAGFVALQFAANCLQLTLPVALDGPVQQLSAALAAHGITLQTRYHATAAVSLHNEKSASQVRQIVLVASGKGGVGKSTTAVNLAVALGQNGTRVGLLDADIYGPSVPLMLGEQHSKVSSADQQFLTPIHKHGIYLQSIGFLVDPEQATVWRGPMASQALWQLINETVWPDLDYLVIDLPPGTGDIQLTLSQKLKVAGAVIVTTPQDVALADAKKAITMFGQVNIPVLGLVENMSYYQCPQCGHADDVFGTGGGSMLAMRYQLPVLGQLPLDSAIRAGGDNGVPIAMTDNQVAEIYKQMAEQLQFGLYWQTRLAANPTVDILMTDD